MSDTLRQAARAAALKAYADELRIQGWWDIRIGEEVLIGFAADAVLDAVMADPGVRRRFAIADAVDNEPLWRTSGLHTNRGDMEHDALLAKIRAAGKTT